MKRLPLVVLLGSSLLIMGLQTSLQAAGRFRILRVNFPDGIDRLRVRALRPAAILYDRQERRADGPMSMSSLIATWPSVLLLELAADSAEVVALRGTRQPISGLADIVQVILAGGASAHAPLVSGDPNPTHYRSDP